MHPELRITYAQLGSKLGINAEAARMVARRRGWLRQAPNRRGAPVFVIVPEDGLDGEQWRSGQPVATPDSTDEWPDTPGLRAGRAEQRADEANARADAALALADRTLAQLADATTRADRADDRADRLERDLAAALSVADLARAEARAAQHAAEELRRRDEARQARSRWARLRERGEHPHSPRSPRLPSPCRIWHDGDAVAVTDRSEQPDFP